MVQNPIRSFFRKRTHATLRLRLRAWKALLGHHDLSFVNMVSSLSKETLELPQNACRWASPELDSELFDRAIRQKLVKQMVYSDLLPKLMCHIHRPELPITLPLPTVWRESLADEGVKLRPSASRWMWLWVQITSFLTGVRRALGLACLCLGDQPSLRGHYGVLLNLQPNSVPRPGGNDDNQVCFATWYETSPLRHPQEEFVWCHVPDKSIEDTWAGNFLTTNQLFPSFDSPSKVIILYVQMLKLVLTTFVDLLVGRWWAPIIMEDRVLLTYYRLLDVDDLAKTYVFNNSNWVLRPLWTYSAEQRGSRIVFAFYSANTEPYRFRNGKIDPLFPGYEIMSWPEYAVWNDAQAEYIDRVTAHTESATHIVGPIPMSDSVKTLPTLPENSIAVFDVSIFRPALSASRGVIAPCYTFESVTGFLKQAHGAITECGMTMVLKRKRDIGSKADKKYTRVVRELEQESNVLIVDPEINAEHLVNQAAAVISIPFTSTAILGVKAGKPSVYFDASARIKPDQGLASGVDVIDSAEALRLWIADLDVRDLKSG